MTDAAAAADPGRHEWHRLTSGWHAVFGTLAVLTGLLLVVDGDLWFWRRGGGLAGLVLLCGWYAVAGARALPREPDRLGATYLVVGAPLTIGLFAVSPAGALMLFALYPHLWAMLPTRWAMAATTATVATTGVVMLAWAGFDPRGWGYVFATAAVALLVALALGLWITRVIAQSQHRARLVRELDAARAELAEVSRRSGILAERERLAREIHDTLAQGFTSVLLLLEAVEAELGRDEQAARDRLYRARRTARENLEESRAMVAALTPPRLRDGSLPEALRQVVAQADQDVAGSVGLTVCGTPRALPANEEVVLLRAAQEALSNVRKHAAASRAEVRLEYGPERIRLRVTDDGRGGAGLERGHGGFGLAGLRERVDQVGGSVEVVAAPDAGVTVSVELAS